MSALAFLLTALLALGASPEPAAQPSASPTPAPSPTATAASPVQVESCSVAYSGNVLIGQSGQLTINFTNYGTVAADVVRFRVQYGNQSLFIRDVGSFAPGIEITHKYNTFEGNLQLSPLLGQKPPVCAVAWSHFANGTIWPPGP